MSISGGVGGASGSGSVSGSGGGGVVPRGISLANTVHSEVASCLPLPSLPVFCGSLEHDLRLFDEQQSGYGYSNELNGDDVVKISSLLQATDVSYLNLRADATDLPGGYVEHLDLYNEVIRFNSEAFEHIASGPIKKDVHNSVVPEKKIHDKRLFAQNLVSHGQDPDDIRETRHQHEHDAPTSSRKPKAKKRGGDESFLISEPDAVQIQDAAVEGFCELLEGLCSRSEIPSEDRDETEWLPLSVADIKKLVNEVMSIRRKKFLHLVPIDLLERMLRILDHQIHRAEGLSINQCEHSNSDIVLSISIALESIHAALLLMAYSNMPKQIYKEEIIERIVEFARRQIMDLMSACDPTYRALNKPSENGFLEDDEEEEDADFGSASKRRRNSRNVKVKRSGANRVSAAVNSILQKLCTLLSLLKDLLLIERLADSCILQLVKTCFSTFLVDNIQLLQLKSISLIGGIFYRYSQHRVYVMDEANQLLLKLPFSKRIPRTYHLPDEEQRQIQMITALLIQLVHCSANLPESLTEGPETNSLFEISIDASYPNQCYDAVTDACCLFWTGVLQRFTNAKNQNYDASELKIMMENLVMDLLTTLNLPEYPASAPILEVLCVLLLQNAGLKSKDIAARSIAIDLLGTIAARLKRDAVLCRRESFWIVQELINGDDVDRSHPKDSCSVCLDERIEKPLVTCQGCHRLFHVDCMGVREHEASGRNWLCQFCLCRKQLLVLHSYCKSHGKVDGNSNRSQSKSGNADITKTEIVQQMLLNYLQDGSSEDMHNFTRWLYLCLWYKADPSCQQKIFYYLARLNSKAITGGSGMVSSLLTRHSVKKITLALGQNNSFSRGYDKIVHLLLASLRENSPIIRAKALRAVSIIVEADPEVLGDKLVQTAVEGRFCDSAISVREAALELVGRYIASHPDVALKYFEKVSERIMDTGVSVRKRAIKIIKDMCTSIASFSEFNSACIKIISRVNDEESSIQDLVCKTFYEFWFEEPLGSERHIIADGSFVTLEIAKKTEQIVEMLRKMPNQQSLVIIIKRNLALDFLSSSVKAAGINPVSLASVRKRCELMCKCLLEKILQVEEMNRDRVEVHSLPYVLLLHAFCLVDPALCAPASDTSQFVITLQPYLKTQVNDRVVAKLLESIVFVIDSVLLFVQKLPPDVVEELEQDLKQMIVRHHFLTVVHACIKCLCSVGKVSGKGASVIENLIQVFFRRLDALGFDNEQQIGRSIFCLGLLIRYGNSLLSTSWSSKQKLDILRSVNLFKKYLQAEDFALKARSLQALGHVLISRPEFMLEKDVGKILEATLSSTTDDRLKMQSLQNMYEYLLDAESQMETEKTDNNGESYSIGDGQSVPVAAGAGDTNICGGIIQLYWNSILERCLDVNEQVRQSALKIVEVVLRQGLVHPITCVPYLIALETDPQNVNSKLSHHLLMNMNEKYPAFFESRLGDGLQMSFMFIQSMSRTSPEISNPKNQPKGSGSTKGKTDGSSVAYARLGVCRIYKLIRGNRVSRNKFMSSIVHKFDIPSCNASVVPFLIYCTEILALLPFTLPEEPLYLVYAINRVIQVRAGSLEANMKALLHMLQGSSQKILPGNGIIQQDPSAQPAYNDTTPVDLNGTVVELEGYVDSTDTASVNVNTKAVNLANPCVISEDDLPKIQVDCLSAAALQLLLKLKRHLKIVYSLDDARCQAFSPNEPPKPGEFLSRQNIPFNISDMSFNLPNSYDDFLQRYQEFKNALREDTVDYSTYTANIKRKRPPARRSVKSGHMNGAVDGDDDYDDDEWGSVVRRPSSGRKPVNTRSRNRS